MTTPHPDAIAILGGTGDQGLGLALRFARAGRPVVIGSRQEERAVAASDEVRRAAPGADVSGAENPSAAGRAAIVILSVPFEHTAPTLKAVAPSLTAGQLVVSMGVPLATAIGDGPLRTVGVWQGSCAELVASLVPKGVEVVSAFQNVSAHRLQQLEEPVECDVIVSGGRGAREKVMALCALVPGLRAVDGGPLTNARYVEAWTALLIGLNVRYKVPEGMGFRLTGLPG
jgi:8-hydroxy-5-deazaflavin:NADPH oxidoreductase